MNSDLRETGIRLAERHRFCTIRTLVQFENSELHRTEDPVAGGVERLRWLMEKK